MKQKLLFTLTLWLTTFISYSQLSNFEEQYLKTFDPQGYSYYRFKEGVSNQGKQIADGLSNRLDKFQTLISSQDPNDLLADFESKMQNIESLEANFIKSSNQFAYNTGQQIGNAINNKDAMGALSGLVGFAEARSEQKEAERKLAAQKKALEQQRLKKMSQIYYKAVAFNETKQKEYLNRAAFSRSLKEEKYNLGFVDNLKCFAKSMRTYFSASSTYWLKNRCEKPGIPTVNAIENKFIAKDVQIRKVAERKYAFYEETGYDEFKDAAISYAASAAKTKGSAANYYLLAKYYATENPVLGLGTLLTVKNINPNYKKKEVAALVEKIKLDVEVEVNTALKKNDVAYINSFLNAGLDRLIKIDGKSILTEAISIDNPDAVQTILNKYIDGLTQTRVNDKIQKTILLCALKDSYKTIERFANLGVSVDFKLGKYHPIDIAVKGKSAKAYKTLLTLSEEADYYKEKYKNSTINIFMNVDSNPLQAAKDIDEISDPKKIKELTTFIYDRIEDNNNMFTVLLNSKNIKAYIKNNAILNQQINERFVNDITMASPTSRSAQIVQSGLVSFSEMPIYGDLIKKEEKTVVANENTDSNEAVMIELFEKVLENQLETTKTYGKQSGTDFSEAIAQMEKSLLNLKKIKISGAPLTAEDKKSYIGMSYSLVANDYQNKYQKYRKPFKNYLMDNYEVKEEISTEQKIDVIIQGIENYMATLKDGQQKSSMTTGLNLWKGYKERADKLLPIEKTTVDTSYPAQALAQGLPLDMAGVDKIGGAAPTVASYLNKKVTYDNLEEKSLALVAFAYNNYELFEVLDNTFDLSKISEPNGKSLFENMVRDSKKLLSNKSYLSKNFNFKDGVVLNEILSTLATNTSYVNASTFSPLVGILVSYKLTNYTFSETGGTLLHLYVETLLKEVNGEDAKYKSDHLEFLIKGLTIDKTIENENGFTAYKMFDDNFSSIKKYWRKDNKERLKRSNGGNFLNGLANKMMRNDQEKEIEALLKPNN